MIYEDKILDYLDGSLGDAESAELMHQLSVSPERRVILEQHLQLKNAISDARKPFAVPADLEAQLAQRLPVIANYSRERAATTFISSARSPYIGRVAAALVALLLLGGIGYFTFEKMGGTDSTTATVDVSTSSGTAKLESQKLPAPGASSPGRASAVSESAASTAAASRSDRQELVASHQSRNTIPFTNVPDNPIGTPIIESSDEREADTPQQGVLNPIQKLRMDQLTLHTIGESPRTSVMRLTQQEAWNLPVVFRLDYNVSQSYNQVRETDASITSRNALAPMVGLDYVVSPRLAFGIEAGKTDISRVEEITSIEEDEELSLKKVIVSHDVVSRSELTTRAMIRYTLNPYDLVRIEASVGGGVSLGDNVSTLLAWSIMGNHRITEEIGLTAGVAFTGTFAQSDGASQREGGDIPVAYIATDQAASSTLFTPSFQFKVGVRVRPW